MRTVLTALVLLGLAAPAARAERLGDHPAVVVQRLQAHSTYDYASKFYPHPAWLFLAAQAPHTMVDHPAVIIARRAAQQGCTSEPGEPPAPWTGSPFHRIPRSPSERQP
jgi:hypothetical protein